MAIILSCENCIGQRFDFIGHEGATLANLKEDPAGSTLAKPKEDPVNGTLVLQQFESGSDKLRITFMDAGNLIKSIWKAFVPWGDPLCHFDFSQQELRTGTKQIKLVQWATIIPLFTYILLCYDFSNGELRRYIFPDEENAKMWAIEIGVTEMETRDVTGELLNKEQF